MLNRVETGNGIKNVFFSCYYKSYLIAFVYIFVYVKKVMSGVMFMVVILFRSVWHEGYVHHRINTWWKLLKFIFGSMQNQFLCILIVYVVVV